MGTINYHDFIHPEDRTALQNMESIPGFPAAMHLFMKYYQEQLCYGLNLAQKIRLSPSQLPDIYNLLPPLCHRLSIPIPDFFLEMNPFPNAYAFGDKRTMITITSGLLEYLSKEEVCSVIAHECGHIACRHMLYYSLASVMAEIFEQLGVLGMAAKPVFWALQYWSRRSEFSADRAAAAALGSAEKVVNVQIRLAGGPSKITDGVCVEEFIKQADEYDSLKSKTWDSILQNYSVLENSHPYAAVRVREILLWSKTTQYSKILEAIKLESEKMLPGVRCPVCQNAIDSTWKFCQICGNRIS